MTDSEGMNSTLTKRPHDEDSTELPQSPNTLKRIKLDDAGLPDSNGENLVKSDKDVETNDGDSLDNNKQPILVNGDHETKSEEVDDTRENCVAGANGTSSIEDSLVSENSNSSIDSNVVISDDNMEEIPPKEVDDNITDSTTDNVSENIATEVTDKSLGIKNKENDVSNNTTDSTKQNTNEENMETDDINETTSDIQKSEDSLEKTVPEESEQITTNEHLDQTDSARYHNGVDDLCNTETNGLDFSVDKSSKEKLEEKAEDMLNETETDTIDKSDKVDKEPEEIEKDAINPDETNKHASKQKADGSEEKENVDVNLPMDLSVKPLVNGHKKSESPDIIMLSDSDSDDNASDTVYANETPEQKQTRKEKMVKKLQRELQNEEAKLMLLKKLRQSQLTLGTEAPVSTSNAKGAIPRTSAPPPLVRQNQQHLLQKKPLPAHQMGSSSHQISSQRSTGPPPLVNMPQSRSSQHQSSTHHSSNLSTSSTASSMIPGYRPVQPAPAAPAQPVDTRTPEQRQASAKMALRKQLEKTLLQIPPPKPPVPEMNFIPSLSSGEFILLVGLNEVVNFIMDIDKGKPEVKYVFNPFTCVQCKTDFTPVWKRDKPGSKNVICENCVISNQKKALKQEHTNRLKSAFVKALQQEQQIEQQIAAEEQDAPSRNVSSSHQMASSSSAITGSPLAGSVAAAAMNYTSKVSSEQLRQHQKMLEAHQAHLRSAAAMGLSGFNPLFNPFQMAASYANKNSKTTDIQRQYLLDMIPSANLAQNVSWQKR